MFIKFGDKTKKLNVKKIKGKKGVGDGMTGVKESFSKEWWKENLTENIVKYFSNQKTELTMF